MATYDVHSLRDAVQHAGARLGSVRRSGGNDTTARRDLAAAQIAHHIAKVVADAPPLTDAQRAHLSGLLTGGEQA